MRSTTILSSKLEVYEQWRYRWSVHRLSPASTLQHLLANLRHRRPKTQKNLSGYIWWMPSNSSSSDPFLQVERCGSVRGEPIYIVTKHLPAKGGNISKAYSIRCMDLGREALGNYKAEEGGCSQTQFFNDPTELRCTKCGQEFSKFYLRQDLYMEIRGLPA